MDDADDIEYAENLLGTLDNHIKHIRKAWDALSEALHLAHSGLPRDLEQAIAMAEGNLSDYCRPTCGNREEPGECTDNTCDCPYHAKQRWIGVFPGLGWQDTPTTD